MDMLKFKAVERNLNGNGSVATSSGIAQTWDNKCTNTPRPRCRHKCCQEAQFSSELLHGQREAFLAPFLRNMSHLCS